MAWPEHDLTLDPGRPTESDQAQTLDRFLVLTAETKAWPRVTKSLCDTSRRITPSGAGASIALTPRASVLFPGFLGAARCSGVSSGGDSARRPRISVPRSRFASTSCHSLPWRSHVWTCVWCLGERALGALYQRELDLDVGLAPPPFGCILTMSYWVSLGSFARVVPVVDVLPRAPWPPRLGGRLSKPLPRMPLVYC